jgi:hypothetical protein
MRVLVSLLVIVGGLLTGWTIKRLRESGHIGSGPDLPRLGLTLQRVSIMGILPVTYCGALWNLDLGQTAIYSMPAVGALVLLTGGAMGLLAGRLLKLPPRQGGAVFCCAMFSNIGSVGALVCYTLLGEPGFALVPAYKLLEEVLYFGLGFPMARAYTAPGRSGGLGAMLRHVATDPFVLCALAGMGSGIGLHLAGVARPEAVAAGIAVLVPLASFCMLTAIGLGMTFGRLTAYPRECAITLAIKFLAAPALACLLARSLGYAQVMDGIPFKVVLILSSMPVAFLALIPPAIYDLDRDMTNACWFASSLFLVIEIPLLAFLTQAF